jgi:hypothetical protein
MKTTSAVFWSVLIIALLVPLLWSCKGTGDFNQNLLPITRLANVPPPDTVITTANPRLTLYWIGDDPDGFVVAFQYRWSFRLNSGSPYQYKKWTTVLNLWNIVGGGVATTDNFALMTDADVPNLPNVYHYFSILQTGLDNAHTDSLIRGDSIHIAGANVWASNAKNTLYPVHTKPTSGTFIFDSQDSLNPHTFEVVAIDNRAARGLPASISFITPRVGAPRTRILVAPNDTVMVVNDKSVSWNGIPFTFQGFDPNSRTVDYQWVVDRDQWPAGHVPWSEFSSQTTVYVTAKDFPDPLATNHTFYVRSRNEFGVIDTAGVYVAARYDANNNVILGYDTIYARADFRTLYPAFRQSGYSNRILIVNMSYNCLGASVGRPDSTYIDQYYSQMLNNIGWSGKYDVFNVIDDSKTKEKKFPNRRTLGQYSTIILVADVINTDLNTGLYDWTHPFSSERKTTVIDYLNIGGKMIFSAWGMPWGLNGGNNDNFMPDICHMQDNTGDLDTLAHPGFLGAFGQKGYPSVVIDTAKVAAVWPKPVDAPGPPDSVWGLHWMYVGRTSGFGEIIYKYNTTDDNTINFGFTTYNFKGQVCATRYIGVTYDVIYLGFPLYFVNCPGVADVPSATAVLRKALSDMNQ